MEGRKSLFPDDKSDAARKKPAVSERCEEDQEASTSRRPEPAYPENAKTQQEKLSQNVRILWELHPTDLDGRAAKDQQRQWYHRYEERRYSAETEHDKQYNDEYHRPRAVWQGTRGHAESANRYPNPYNNYRGRSAHQRGFRGREFNDERHYRNDGRSQSPQQQSDNRERQRRNPDQWETVRKPHRNISPSGSSKGLEMHSSQEIDPKFRKVILESPWLYDPSRVECKDKVLEEQSWTDVSSACGMTVAQCKSKFKQVQNRYRRLKKIFADNGSLSAPDMQFINDWQFIPYKKRTTTQHTRPTVSPTANQTQSPPTPRSVSPELLLSSDSGIRTNNPMPDQSFADDFAATIQDWSPEQKAKFKRACYELVGDFMQKCAL